MATENTEIIEQPIDIDGTNLVDPGNNSLNNIVGDTEDISVNGIGGIINTIRKKYKSPILLLFIIGLILYSIYFVSAHILDLDIVNLDPLNKHLFSIGPIQVGLWPISHLILYMILGYIYPDYWLQISIMGIIWEFVEFTNGALTDNPITATEKDKEKKSGQKRMYDKKWMAGNAYDILFNTVGLIIGVNMARLMPPRSST